MASSSVLVDIQQMPALGLKKKKKGSKTLFYMHVHTLTNNYNTVALVYNTNVLLDKY